MIVVRYFFLFLALTMYSLPMYPNPAQPRPTRAQIDAFSTIEQWHTDQEAKKTMGNSYRLRRGNFEQHENDIGNLTQENIDLLMPALIAHPQFQIIKQNIKEKRDELDAKMLARTITQNESRLHGNLSRLLRILEREDTEPVVEPIEAVAAAAPPLPAVAPGAAAAAAPVTTIPSLDRWARSCFRDLPEFSYKVPEVRGLANFEGVPRGPVTQDLFNRTLSAFIETMRGQLTNRDQWCTPHGATEPARAVAAAAAAPEATLPDGFFDPNREDYSCVYAQKVILRPGSKIMLMGDLHGSLHSLLRNLLRLKQMGRLRDDFTITDNNNYVFTGDYIDRGRYSTEILVTLMNLKIKNPDKVVLLRGNHEYLYEKRLPGNGDNGIDHSFYDECKYKFDNDIGTRIFKQMFYSFKLLPSVCFLGKQENQEHNFIMASHGGLEIGYDPRRLLESGATFQKITHINRPRAFNRMWQGIGLANLPNLLADPVWETYVMEELLVNFHITKECKLLGFLESSFKNLENAPEKTLYFGRNIPCFYLAKLTDTLERLSPRPYVIKSIFQGHEHNPSAVGVNPRTLPRKVTDMARQGQIDTPGFILMSAPEGLDDGLSVDGFAIVTAAAHWPWNIEPHSYGVPIPERNSANVQIVGEDFNWRMPDGRILGQPAAAVPIAAPAAAAAAPRMPRQPAAETEWICDICTYAHNLFDAANCTICGEPRTR
jgi:hypothetical protein